MLGNTPMENETDEMGRMVLGACVTEMARSAVLNLKEGLETSSAKFPGYTVERSLGTVLPKTQ